MLNCNPVGKWADWSDFEVNGRMKFVISSRVVSVSADVTRIFVSWYYSVRRLLLSTDGLLIH